MQKGEKMERVELCEYRSYVFLDCSTNSLFIAYWQKKEFIQMDNEGGWNMKIYSMDNFLEGINRNEFFYVGEL